MFGQGKGASNPIHIKLFGPASGSDYHRHVGDQFAATVNIGPVAMTPRASANLVHSLPHRHYRIVKHISRNAKKKICTSFASLHEYCIM